MKKMNKKYVRKAMNIINQKLYNTFGTSLN